MKKRESSWMKKGEESTMNADVSSSNNRRELNLAVGRLMRALTTETATQAESAVDQATEDQALALAGKLTPQFY
jgi:hypothetical protein